LAGHGILSLTIKDKAVLYAAYMPFIQYGGLFIPTNKHYQIGSEIFMLLKLMDETEKLPVAGKVVWVTPPRAQGARVRGIGVQFSDPEATVKIRIENILADQLGSNLITNTL
jgi:type IV pilus assembly protein PilZ